MTFYYEKVTFFITTNIIVIILSLNLKKMITIWYKNTISTDEVFFEVSSDPH